MRTHLAAIGCLLVLCLPAAAQTAMAPPGASSCSGCHDAAIANSAVAPLKGRAAADIVDAMDAFRTGKREATVMTRIAKGFSEDETRAIATWLARR